MKKYREVTELEKLKGARILLVSEMTRDGEINQKMLESIAVIDQKIHAIDPSQV